MFNEIYWYSCLSRSRLHTVVRPLIFKVSRRLFTDLFTGSARLTLWARTQPCWKRYWHTYRVSTLTFWARYTGTTGHCHGTDPGLGLARFWVWRFAIAIIYTINNSRKGSILGIVSDDIFLGIFEELWTFLGLPTISHLPSVAILISR